MFGAFLAQPSSSIAQSCFLFVVFSGGSGAAPRPQWSVSGVDGRTGRHPTPRGGRLREAACPRRTRVCRPTGARVYAPRLNYFLATCCFGLVCGGSRGLLGRPRRTPRLRRMALASRGGPKPPGPGPANLKTHTLCGAILQGSPWRGISY